MSNARSNALSGDELTELAESFADEQEARSLLDDVRYSRARQPSWRTAMLFWSAVARELSNGVIADGRRELLAAAARRYPHNPVFAAAAAPASGRQASPSSGQRRWEPADDQPVTVTVLMVDAVGFSKQKALTQRAWRQAIYQVTETAFAAADVPAGSVLRQEDRGDGYLALVDVGVPLPTLVADFARELGIALRAHNSPLSTDGKVRLRVAVNQGFVLFDRRGFTSDPVVVTARLCDAEPVRAALRDEPAANVALVLSDNVYQATVAENFRGLDEADFRQVEVHSAKFDGVGWLQVDGRRPASASKPTAAAPQAGSAAGAAGDDDDGWDFFVSYAKADEEWAKWIVGVLEDAEYQVHASYLFDVAGGGKRTVVETGMLRSKKTIAVLTRAYLESPFVDGQWGYAWDRDPNGVKRKLVPVKVEACQPTGFLQTITSIDLVGRVGADAAQHLLAEVKASIVGRRPRPPGPPVYPLERL